MKDLTFITGNQHKADILAKHLGIAVAHHKLDLDELQSLDLRVVAEHKARQAYGIMGKPVLIEDVSLIFHALGALPGTFIKWFIEELELQQVCDLLAPYKDRSATAAICYCIYDGTTTHFFEGEAKGSIAPAPRGMGGFGFDPIFIPAGHAQTRAEMSEDIYVMSSHRTIAMDKLREFLTN
jgi:non-canonical purine NTP pyrophosphatase (RdgB/HAM1 family)